MQCPTGDPLLWSGETKEFVKGFSSIKLWSPADAAAATFSLHLLQDPENTSQQFLGKVTDDPDYIAELRTYLEVFDIHKKYYPTTSESQQLYAAIKAFKAKYPQTKIPEAFKLAIDVAYSSYEQTTNADK